MARAKGGNYLIDLSYQNMAFQENNIFTPTNIKKIYNDLKNGINKPIFISLAYLNSNNEKYYFTSPVLEVYTKFPVNERSYVMLRFDGNDVTIPTYLVVTITENNITIRMI